MRCHTMKCLFTCWKHKPIPAWIADTSTNSPYSFPIVVGSVVAAKPIVVAGLIVASTAIVFSAIEHCWCLFGNKDSRQGNHKSHCYSCNLSTALQGFLQSFHLASNRCLPKLRLQVEGFLQTLYSYFGAKLT